MFRKTYQLLYGTRPASFETPGTVEAAVDLLTSQVRPSAWHAPFTEGLVGIVAPDRVALHRYRPFWRNDFRPRFIGHFVQDGGRVRLIGGFRIGLYSRVFMLIWFGLLGLWILLTLLGAAVTMKDDARVLLMPLAGVAMVLFGIGLVNLCVWMSSSDQEYIISRLEAVLGPRSVSPSSGE